jgi:hypothetical protein
MYPLTTSNQVEQELVEVGDAPQTEFLVNISCSFSYVPDKVQSVKKGAMTPKLAKAELWFLCIALLLKEINLPYKVCC